VRHSANPQAGDPIHDKKFGNQRRSSCPNPIFVSTSCRKAALTRALDLFTALTTCQTSEDSDNLVTIRNRHATDNAQVGAAARRHLSRIPTAVSQTWSAHRAVFAEGSDLRSPGAWSCGTALERGRAAPRLRRAA
jgi:hypothetical protein